MLSHSFDQFYIVTRFELPKAKDLRLVTFKFDFKCSYANHTSTNINYAKLSEILYENCTLCMILPKTNTILQPYSL